MSQLPLEREGLQRKEATESVLNAVPRAPGRSVVDGPARSQGPVQRAPAGGAARTDGAWEADEGLMDAMGLAQHAVQRKRTTESSTASEMETRAQAGVSGGGGAVPHQAKMESAFGTSFAGVSAHTGPQASAACDALGAQAYATGNRVAFKDASPSESLVGHELTHVMQQRAGVQNKGAGESASLEAEADAVGARVAAGESVADVTHKYSGGAAAASVQRKEDEAAGGAAGAKAGAPGKAPKSDAGGKGGKGGKDAMPELPGGKEPPAEAMENTSDSFQRARDTAWGGNYVEVQPVSGMGTLIGNVTPGHSGSYGFDYSYSVRLLYVGDTKGGLSFGGTKVVEKGHKVSSSGGLLFGASLPHTKPGTWSAWLHNPGGVFSGSMHAEETFKVVPPITLTTRKPDRLIYDFENPIPIQMTGDSELKFKLSSAMVHAKRAGIAAGGSAGSSVSEKMSFGIKLALDNDAGSEGGAEWGMSSASTSELKKEWKKESYSAKEKTEEAWMEQTYHPTKKDKGRSKMLVPTYKWVEWNTDVYPHDPATLQVTGAKKTAVIGYLIPTGKFTEHRSTDPGDKSDSKPTEGAQVDPTDTAHNPDMEKQFKEDQPSAATWRTLPGARWDEPGKPKTLQFAQGPIKVTPAERDYGIQEGHPIHPGNEKETSSEGMSSSLSAEDGLTASHSEETSGITTNNVSKSIEAMPGIKGIGQLGDSLKFENESSISSSITSEVSSSSSSKSTTSVSVTSTVTKTDKNQFILFTPLYTHKVYKVGWGAKKPDTGNTVSEGSFSVGYIHTYKHTPIPHVKVWDTPTKDPKVKDGAHFYPEHVPV